MKTLLIAIVIVGVLGGGIAIYKQKPVEYIQTAVQTKEVVKEVNPLDVRIENAINASSTQIEAESKQAYETKKSQMQTEVKLAVTRTYRAEIEAKEAELEKQASF